MKKKNICFAAATILFAAVSCWWITYFPYNREMLYRAVPLSSDLIYEQPNLYKHLKEAGPLALLDNIAEGTDIEVDIIRKNLGDETFDGILKAVASSTTLIARVPALSRDVKPAIVFASWAGARGQFIKWGMSRVLEGKAVCSEYDYGVKIWSIMLPEPAGYKYLSLSFFEGVFVGCLSHRSNGVAYVLERMVYSGQIVPALRKRLRHGVETKEGWLVFQNEPLFGSQTLNLSFSKNEDGFTGKCSWEKGNPFKIVQKTEAYEDHCREAVDLLGKAPGAVLFSSYDFLEWQLVKNDKRRVMGPLLLMLRENIRDNTAVFICQCGPDYSGRIWGLKTSSLLMGFKLKDPSSFQETVARCLDTVNSAYRTNLIAPASSYNGHNIYHLERVTGPFFKGMEPDERPAMSVIGDWFILASNSSVLRQLIEMEPDSGVVEGVDFVESTVSLWADLESLKWQVENTVTMNNLWAIDRNVSRENTFSRVLTGLQYGLKSLPGRKTIVLSTQNEGDETELNMQVY